MLTEAFKKQALEKLQNATPEQVMEVLRSIGSRQVDVSVYMKSSTATLCALPSKSKILNGLRFYSSYSFVSAESICYKSEDYKGSFMDTSSSEEGYAA